MLNYETPRNPREMLLRMTHVDQSPSWSWSWYGPWSGSTHSPGLPAVVVGY